MKKSKTNILVIPLPIYRVTVVVAWDISVKDVFAHCRKKECVIPKKWEEDALATFARGNGGCCHLGPDNTDVLVWVRGNLSRTSKASEYGVLYHELFHAVDKITDTHNMAGETECRAYIFEWLITECNKFFWAKKK